MWRLSNLAFYRAPPKFTFIGSPVRERGPGHEISASYVLTEGFHKEPIKIHCVPGYASLLYLAEYTQRKQFLLLDCGYPSDYLRVKFYVEEVLSKEQNTQLTVKDNLRLAVSTHCHIDHCGAASGFHEEHVPLVRPTDMESSYAGFGRTLLQLFECIIAISVGRQMGRRPENPLWYTKGLLGPHYPMPPAIQELKHGDALPFGFDDWVAVKIPGHTTHMIALYHTPSRILYTADLMVKLKKGFFAPRPVDYDWAYSNTLNRVRKLDVGYALMSHGGLVDVEKQYGSWNAVLDSIANHHRFEMENPVPKKPKHVKWNAFLRQMITKSIRSLPVEKRPFTRMHLDTGTMPSPMAQTAPVTILDK